MEPALRKVLVGPACGGPSSCTGHHGTRSPDNDYGWLGRMHGDGTSGEEDRQDSITKRPTRGKTSGKDKDPFPAGEVVQQKRVPMRCATKNLRRATRSSVHVLRSFEVWATGLNRPYDRKEQIMPLGSAHTLSDQTSRETARRGKRPARRAKKSQDIRRGTY